ncbi:MAG: ribosomal protein S18-alanine N-acetyltransferase [Holosporales bacterium]|jgi:ribosomal-protein-alanine N-acetyltransferase|nr:ribosomal protein S18-alanine N-acetyltransferase [Holosporales bacterium]
MTYRTIPIRQVSTQRLAEIHQQCLPSRWSSKDFALLYADPAYNGFALEENQLKVVGFIDLHVVVEEAEVYSFCITPEHRGKGLGQKLLKKLFTEAHQRNIQKIFLEVSEANTAGRHLYRALGFKEVGRRYGYYPQTDHGTTAIVLCSCPENR